MPLDEVADIRRADRGPTSLDQGVGEDGDTALGDLIAGDGPSVEDEVVAGIEDERLREAVDTLPEAERDVITLRFGLDREQPQALRETGRRLGPLERASPPARGPRTAPAGAGRRGLGAARRRVAPGSDPEGSDPAVAVTSAR